MYAQSLFGKVCRRFRNGIRIEASKDVTTNGNLTTLMGVSIEMVAGYLVADKNDRKRGAAVFFGSFGRGFWAKAIADHGAPRLL